MVSMELSDDKGSALNDGNSTDFLTEDPDDEIDLTETEVQNLNNQLDELNSALDALEEKNESIQARLLDFLHTSREERLRNSESGCPLSSQVGADSNSVDNDKTCKQSDLDQE